MNETDKQKLKKWCSGFFEASNLSIDLFDFDKEIDINLSIAENKTILREKLKVFFNQYSDEQTQNLKKEDIERLEQKPQTEVHIQQVRHEIEEQAKIEFNTSLKEIFSKKDTSLLENKFFLLRNYVKMVCNKNINGLIVEGEAGTGKSHNILKVLQESEKNFIYCSGFTTSLELYNFLYEHKDKIIFFDDTKSIFRNEASLEILKASLFSPTNTRIVRYLSTTTKLKAPSQFVFEGGIIVAINDIGKYSEDLKAVVDRVLYYNVKFSYDEKIKIIADLIKQDYKEISQDDRQYIFNFIKENTNEATLNLNFRLLWKLYEIFRYSKNDFERMAHEIIRTDERKEFLLQVVKRNNSVSQAQKEWCNITGMSRSQFFRVKKELVS